MGNIIHFPLNIEFCNTNKDTFVKRSVMALKSHIPNFITCLNLMCGCLAVILSLDPDAYQVLWAVYLIWAAALFDFLDGLSARLLKRYSALGKQLDSLADMVSFGLAPGLILYSLILDAAAVDQEWMAYCALAIPLFSALRLANFNLDDKQRNSFHGLPTPANALLVGSLPLLILKGNVWIAGLLEAPATLAGLGIVLAVLLVSKIRMFSLKAKTYGWSGNEVVYTFLAASVCILFLLPYSALPIIILLYISISVIQSLLFKRRKSYTRK